MLLKLGDLMLRIFIIVNGEKEAMYVYVFNGRRYDVGDRLGFLEATVDYALKREDLREDFMDYMKKIICFSNED